MNIKDMTLEQKIGQLFVVGFTGIEINNHIKTLIEKYHAGNVILFTRNIGGKNSLKKLNIELQKLMINSNKIAGFISIDQEGGMVTRIKEGGTRVPGNMALAAINDNTVTNEVGMIMGDELKSLGINTNFAPVLDVNNNPDNPIIGVRSYSDNPDRVVDLAKGFINTLKEKNILAVGKHFPGHGDTSEDSHLALPSVPHGRERLEKIELLPFKKSIKNGLDAIMSAHILFPAIDDSGVPATLSKKILTGLLREELGFQGLIISDCMEMKAIGEYYGTSEAAIKAIEAGINQICICHTEHVQIEAMEAVKNAVLTGRISEELINERVIKVLELKDKYNVNNIEQLSLDDSDFEKNQKKAIELSERSITIVRDEDNLIPLKNKIDLVMSPLDLSLNIADDERDYTNFAEELSKEIEIPYLNFGYDVINYDEILSKVKENSNIIFGSYNLSLSNSQKQLLDRILEKTENVILVCLRNPYDANYSKKVKSVICAYEYTIYSVKAVIKVLTGKIEAKGILPINI